MSDLSDTAKLYEKTRRLNLAHEFDIMRWFSQVVEHWLKTGIKLNPTSARLYMFEEMSELWGPVSADEPILVPPADKNSREYPRWVVKWAAHFLKSDAVNREHIVLVINEVRERVSLPPLGNI